MIVSEHYATIDFMRYLLNLTDSLLDEQTKQHLFLPFQLVNQKNKK